MGIRIGRIAVTAEYYRVGCGWGLHRWNYGGESSWRHGTARLGRVKLIW